MVWSSNGRSVRRTVDLYDERQPLADTKPGGLRVGGKSCGSRSRRSGTVVDRRRARKAAQAASTSTMEAACDQSRRPRCWPLGRGALPVRGCSASASGLPATALAASVNPSNTAGLERTRSSRHGAFAAAARQSQVVRSGNLDRDDPRACLRGDGGVSAEDGERSPDCRIARRSNLGRGRGCSVANRQWCVAARVDRTPQGHPGIASPAAG